MGIGAVSRVGGGSNKIEEMLRMMETAQAATREMQQAGSVMTRMTDGFDAPKTKSGPQTSTAKGKSAAPKKKGGGLFGKIAGFLKKALPIISKIASFIPGLNAIAKPLELASSFLNKAEQ
jgi:hypothetical protein